MKATATACAVVGEVPGRDGDPGKGLLASLQAPHRPAEQFGRESCWPLVDGPTAQLFRGLAGQLLQPLIWSIGSPTRFIRPPTRPRAPSANPKDRLEGGSGSLIRRFGGFPALEVIERIPRAGHGFAGAEAPGAQSLQGIHLE